MTAPAKAPRVAVRRRLAWIAAAFLLASAIAVPLYRAGAGGTVGASGWVMEDFLNVVYYPAVGFADGVNPYDASQYAARYPASAPFRAYPPALLLITQPFSLLSPTAAARVQAILTVIFTALLAWWSLSLAGAGVSALGVTALTAIILLSRPGHWNLLQGHITIPVVLAVYAALTLPRARATAGAIALTVALLKPNFGVPLAILMLAAGRPRAVAAGIALTALLNLPVLGILSERSGGVMRAARLMIHGPMPEASERSLEYFIFRVDLSALLSRFAGALGSVLPFLIGIGVLTLAGALIRRRLRAVGEDRVDLVSTVLASTAILLCVYHIGYDLLLLVWPATAIVVGFVARGGARPRRAWLELGLIGILAGNYLATYTALPLFGIETATALFAVSLNGLAVLGLFCLYARDSITGAPAWASAPGHGPAGRSPPPSPGSLAPGTSGV